MERGTRTLDKFGDILPDEGDTHTVRVCTDRTYFFLKLLRARNDILRECIRRKFSQCWPFHQRRDLWRPLALFDSESDSFFFYLSGESDRRLIQPLLLGISYVRGDNPVERKAMVSFLELVAVLLSLDRELTAYGVLHFQDRRVQMFDR